VPSPPPAPPPPSVKPPPAPSPAALKRAARQRALARARERRAQARERRARAKHQLLVAAVRARAAHVAQGPPDGPVGVVRTAAAAPVAADESRWSVALIAVPSALAAFGLAVFLVGLVPGRVYLRASDHARSHVVADLAYRLGQSRGELSALGLCILAAVGIALAAVRLVAGP
jgi:hypothetical protein